MRNVGFLASDLAGIGYGITDLLNGGYDSIRDVRPLFTATQYRSAGYGVSTLRTVGFTPSEIKSAGAGLTDMINGGFNIRNDLKPILTATEFR